MDGGDCNKTRGGNMGYGTGSSYAKVVSVESRWAQGRVEWLEMQHFVAFFM